MYDQPAALGVVVEQGRGSLPFMLIHGESLVGCAALALASAGVQAVDMTTTWDAIVEFAGADGAGGDGDADYAAFVLHDALCPMMPASFIAECVERALATDTVVVGVRPVTDTVKTVVGGLIAETLDRDQLLAVASPIVLPASVISRLDHAPGDDFPAVVAALAERFQVTTVVAPTEGRRVTTPEDVKVLEALTLP